MTKNTNEVIIDGVDVNECARFCANDGGHSRYEKEKVCEITQDWCKDYPNCYFKQLQRLKKENEEIKQKNYELENDFAVQIQATLYHQNEWLKLSKENEELKEFKARILKLLYLAMPEQEVINKTELNKNA